MERTWKSLIGPRLDFLRTSLSCPFRHYKDQRRASHGRCVLTWLYILSSYTSTHLKPESSHTQSQQISSPQTTCSPQTRTHITQTHKHQADNVEPAFIKIKYYKSMHPKATYLQSVQLQATDLKVSFLCLENILKFANLKF